MADVPTIAVVDDDIGIREALEGLIQALGFRVVLFESAEDFLGSAAEMTFACMVVDIQMSGLNGIELQTLLNEQDMAPPIIFMTSSIDAFTCARALAGGASCFLGKPVRQEAFLDCLKKVLIAC